MVEINSFYAEYPLLNDNKRTKINFVDSFHRTEVIFKEIFEKEDYRDGLEYLKGVENPVCLDIGGHLGFASLYFNNAKNATIYTLEPNPDVFKAMKLNLAPYPNIHPVNVGIRAWNGSGEMRSDSSRSLPDSFYGIGDLSVKADFLTLRDFMKSCKIDHVDLMKLDVEGTEYETFLTKGFSSVEDRIDFIVGESHYTPKFGPNVIPGMLENYDVKFLDTKNCYYKIDVEIDGKLVTKNISLSTLFTARRKK